MKLLYRRIERKCLSKLQERNQLKCNTITGMILLYRLGPLSATKIDQRPKNNRCENNFPTLKKKSIFPEIGPLPVSANINFHRLSSKRFKIRIRNLSIDRISLTMIESNNVNVQSSGNKFVKKR